MFVSKRLSVIFGEFKTVVIGYFTIVDYNQYDSSVYAGEINGILDLLTREAYGLSDEEYKKFLTPIALIEDETIKNDLYINAAGDYISEYIIKLDLNPQDAYKYFEIALRNIKKRKNENEK